MRRFYLACVVAILVTVFSASAFAQGDTRLILPDFQGAKPQGLRELSVELLTKDGFEIVGQPTGLNPKGDDETFAQAAVEHGALAIVLAQTTLTKKSWRTAFTVREGKSGKVVGRTELSSTWYPGLQKAYRESLVARLMTLLEQCEPATASSKTGAALAVPAKPQRADADADRVRQRKTAPDDKQSSSTAPLPQNNTTNDTAARDTAARDTAAADNSDPDDTRSDEKVISSPQVPAVAFSIGPGGSLRNWTINDPLREANDGPLLSGHSAPAIGLRVALQVFPAAFLTQHSVRHVGLDLQFTRSFIGQTDVANVTNDPEDELRNTVIQSYFAGLHIRIPVAPLQFGVIAGFGEDAITIDGSKQQVAVPDVQAQFVRGALSGRFHFIPTTSANFTIGYRYLLSLGEEPGQVQSALWFPKRDGDQVGAGVEARLEVQHLLSSWFGLSLGGGLTHYALDFNVRPDRVEQAEDDGQPPPPIAGGATDVYTTFDLNAVFLLGGL